MKLKTKLTLSFILLVLIMASILFLYTEQVIDKRFNEYLYQNLEVSLNEWQTLLQEYYKKYGWDGIKEFLQIPQADATNGFGYGRNKTGIFRPTGNVLVIDANNIVIADQRGELVGQQVKEEGLVKEIINDGRVVGKVMIIRDKPSPFINIEQNFMESFRKSIILGSLLTIIIAVLLSLILSRHITKPLEQLMEGIQRVRSGDKTNRIKIETKDEFEKIGNAFNEMTEQLRKNEEARRTLVADVAHELRTPLSVLQGQLELIQDGVLPLNQENTAKLNDEVLRLSRLVNDLQQVSLAEAGKLPLKLSETNISELINDVIFNFQFLAEEKGIKIIYNNSIVNRKIKIDRDRIKQVLINLIGNALKSTGENGKIVITSEEIEEKLIVSIQDTGIGIAKEHLPYIFDRFYRTDTGRNREAGGSGLGLAITKGYVEAHNGTITVESELGKGTTFTFSLPYQP